MIRSLWISKTGLDAQQTNMDVISNNLANVSTNGFKRGRAVFEDLLYQTLRQPGAQSSQQTQLPSGLQVGTGVRPVATERIFTQGNMQQTGNPLDVAINGGGFYRMSQNGVITYSRNGQFHLDSQGYLVDSNDLHVTGYGVDASGNVVATSPTDIQISTSDLAPSPTGKFGASMNLDARASVPVTGAFSQTDPSSYTSTTSGTVYDSLGNAHVFSLYLVKTATSGQWKAYGSIDGSALANVNLGSGAGNPATINFNSSGALTTAMPLTATLTLTNGAVTPLTTTLDFTGTTQYGANFSVNALTQNGYTSGRLSGMNIGSDGTISGRYSNGQTKNLGQIVLASFANPEGLKPLGDDQWSESSDSGLPVVGVPGSGSLGVVQSSAVEDSNVDLTAELVNMITAQRAYQANAQTIKTQDEVLQTLVNLKQ